MNTDENVANTIKPGYRSGNCAFKILPTRDFKQGTTQILCKNPYNVKNICNRKYCPLANMQYGTVRHDDGDIYLKLKTVERAHLPSRLWETIRLPKNRDQAFEEIDDQMIGEYRDEYIDACKERYDWYKEEIKGARKMKLRSLEKVKVNMESNKSTKRESRREKAALQASRINLKVEQDLVDRLQMGLYGDLYDVGPQYLPDEKGISEEEEEEEEEAVATTAAVGSMEEEYESVEEDSVEDERTIEEGIEEDEEEEESGEPIDIEDIGGDDRKHRGDIVPVDPLKRKRITFLAQVSDSDDEDDDDEDYYVAKKKKQQTVSAKRKKLTLIDS